MFINAISARKANYKYHSYCTTINKNFSGRILTFEEIEEKIYSNEERHTSKELSLGRI